MPTGIGLIALVKKHGMVKKYLFIKVPGSNGSKFFGSKFDKDVIFLRNNTRNIPKITEEIVNTLNRNMKVALEEKNRSLER